MFQIPESVQAYWEQCGEPKATTADISLIEATISSKLAIPYIEFITQFGFVAFNDVPGIGMRYLFDYTIDFSDRKEIHEGDIAFFRDAESLIKAYKYATMNMLSEGLPKFPANYLPVGNDAGQGQILLELGENAGRVWYWPENDNVWGSKYNSWLGFVADDFYQFINKLRP